MRKLIQVGLIDNQNISQTIDVEIHDLHLFM